MVCRAWRQSNRANHHLPERFRNSKWLWAAVPPESLPGRRRPLVYTHEYERDRQHHYYGSGEHLPAPLGSRQPSTVGDHHRPRWISVVCTTNTRSDWARGGGDPHGATRFSPSPGIVNAASYAQVNGAGSPVAPGALVAIFTSQLDTQAANFTTATLPPELSNVSVTFNNITAPMVTVSPTGQFPFVSAQVPFGVLGTQPSGTVAVVITVNGTPSKPVQESIIPSQPGIFTIPATGQGNAIMVFTNPATHQPAIAAPAGSGITYPIAPIPRGTPAFFYVNGLGLTTPPVPDGGGTCPAPDGACAANATPTVLVGGISAPVSFAGQAPGFPGVFQVNIMIPQNAPTGDNVPVVVKSADGSVTSNTATIAVQ